MSEFKRHESHAAKKYLQYKLRVLHELVEKALAGESKLHIMVTNSVMLRHHQGGMPLLVVSKNSCPGVTLVHNEDDEPTQLLLQLKFKGVPTTVILYPNEFSIETLHFIDLIDDEGPVIEKVTERVEGNVVFTNFKK